MGLYHRSWALSDMEVPGAVCLRQCARGVLRGGVPRAGCLGQCARGGVPGAPQLPHALRATWALQPARPP